MVLLEAAEIDRLRVRNEGVPVPDAFQVVLHVGKVWVLHGFRLEDFRAHTL